MSNTKKAKREGKFGDERHSNILKTIKTIKANKSVLSLVSDVWVAGLSLYT